MNKIHCRLTSTIILLGVSLSVTISADTLHVRRAANTTGSWCWAGAMECVVKYYDSTTISKTQAQIVSHITTNKNEAPSARRILTGLRKSLAPVNVTVTEYTTPPTEQELKAETDSNELIYLFHTWIQQGGYHASVYVGYIGSQHYLMDPWQNTNQNTKYARRSYRQLMNDGRLKWQRCFKFKKLQPTGINDKNIHSSKENASFKVLFDTYPSSNFINITFHTVPVNEQILNIFNMRGICVYKTVINTNSTHAKVNMSNAAISSGAYFISIAAMDDDHGKFVNSSYGKQILYITK